MAEPLSVPDLPDDCDMIKAALRYAEAGWYVLPIAAAVKHAGSVLGKGWPGRTSRDPAQIVTWFAGTSYGLALHCGRSGAVVFDVDRPDAVPDELAAEFAANPAPMQATRVDEAARGHYVYRQPDGRGIGNSGGALGGAWGEVRGRNGIIVVAPTSHQKAAEGGRYWWMRAGPVPVLSAAVAGLLPDQGTTEDAADDAAVEAFLAAHTTANAPDRFAAVASGLRYNIAAGKGRHPSAVDAACWAARESRAGLYDARTAFAALGQIFHDALAAERGRHPATEWRGIVAWAIAQAERDDPAARAAAVAERTALPPWPAVNHVVTYDHGGSGASPTTPVDVASGAAPGSGAPAPAPATVGESVAAPGTDPGTYTDQLARAVIVERLRRDARRAVDDIEHARAWAAPTEVGSLAQWLAQPDDGPVWRIEGMLGVGHNAIVVSGRKAGKTTMVDTLIRSYVDGYPFLMRFDVTPSGRGVAVFNYEVDARQYRRWLREVGIAATDRVHPLNLRGSTLPLTNPRVQAWLIKWLSERDIGLWIIDPYSRAYLGSVTDGDREAQVSPFLDAIDVIKARAGVDEAVMPVHTPKAKAEAGEETAIGSQRLEAWPDAIWYLVRDRVSGARYLRAEGRDVHVRESLLRYDHGDRSLSLDPDSGRAGAGSPGRRCGGVRGLRPRTPRVLGQGHRGGVGLGCRSPWQGPARRRVRRAHAS